MPLVTFSSIPHDVVLRDKMVHRVFLLAQRYNSTIICPNAHAPQSICINEFVCNLYLYGYNTFDTG